MNAAEVTTDISAPTNAADPPAVANPATATANTITGTTAALSVLGADDGAEARLRYSWSVISGPAGATFSRNGSHSASSTQVTFTQAGNYTLRATITDAAGQSVLSDVNATVNPTATFAAISPQHVTITVNQTQQF